MTALPQGSAPGSTADEPAEPAGEGGSGDASAVEPQSAAESGGPGTAERVAEAESAEDAAGAGELAGAEADGGAGGDADLRSDEPRPDGEGGADGEGDADSDPDPSSGSGSDAGDGDGDAADDTAGDATAEAAQGSEAAAPELSDAAAELAAQRKLRARIEQRKAEKEAPIPAGTKLSGTAADLLAAVRAVEKGEKSGAAFFAGPPPAPRRPAPGPAQDAAPARPRSPEPAQAPVTSDEALAAVRAVLTRGGAPETLAAQVTGALGEQAAERLDADPWQLLAVPGVRPEQADGFARALLGAECRPDDERRAAALVGWILEQAAVQGHTALPADDVRTALAARSVPDPDEAVNQAVAEGVVLVFQDGIADEPGLDDAAAPDEADEADETGEGEAEPVEVLLGLDRYALAEESLADGLARLLNAPVRDDGSVWPEGGELVRAVAGSGLVAHTGGEAARAESAAVVTAAAAAGLRAAGAAHTADGQRRLAELTGPLAAFTVAGLLSGDGPGRDAEGALALDVLVVQDATQLDVETAAVLVESLPDGCRLVLSGDPGVLRPAGAGLVFHDVLTARVCPVVASRMPDPGPVGELVSGIGIGELNQVEAPGKEVVIVPVRDAGEAVHRAVQLLADSIPRAIGIPAEQTQVITVGHGGSAGTRALNAALKQRLNPGPGRFGGFDPADRVAYAQSPGRTVTGTVAGADAEGLRLDCAGKPVLVPKERVESALRHGWALTAHQAAGMRWPAVVVVLPGDAAQGLNRAWVYTAFGRAERHLSVVHGVDQALPRAVAELLPPPRTTRLAPLLHGLLKPAEQ
ncbi:ATP-dependent RecD-like DNA helicase [Streptomyces sp. NBC_00083]|uniref:ATP-dependent DNA helicase n=1 Tax=Streptomyces sp. NBC_00083 TaxID=2975647 RepID=UPI002258DBEB|nr:ATP-dependent RecD-like DNA helicase [Streptomyces sp. NBC_00083]MCX5383405.1 ATP-dependent RecD-like DNA helicase [Streptomyces sp. NBC_00083]